MITSTKDLNRDCTKVHALKYEHREQQVIIEPVIQISEDFICYFIYLQLGNKNGRVIIIRQIKGRRKIRKNVEAMKR